MRNRRSVRFAGSLLPRGDATSAVQAKQLLSSAGVTGQVNVVGSSMIAGVVAAAFSLPFDFVKTRIQKMEKGPDGKYPYKGPLDCAMKTFTTEGPLKFYTGTSSLTLLRQQRNLCTVFLQF